MTCHKGHELVYRKISSFFCDCQFKSNCISLADELKEHKSKASLRWDGFGKAVNPFGADQPPPWRRGDYTGRGGFSRADYGGRGDYGRGGFRGGRGRGRGGRGKRHHDRDVFVASTMKKK
jgi:hypothetical protein